MNSSKVLSFQPTQDALGFMTQLSPYTSMYQPDRFTATSPTIILCTWMKAAPIHIAFYLRKYQEILPSARLILIQGTIPNMSYISASTQERNLAPIFTLMKEEPNSPVLLHLFSNAGAQSASMLLRAYQNSPLTDLDRLPVKGMLFDSTPSPGTYSNAYAGISYEATRLPAWLQPLGYLFAHFLVCLMLVIEAVTRRANVLTHSYEQLNDPSLVAREAPRVYFYSKEDMLVKWQAVEQHAAVARNKGWLVYVELFVGTGHCRHGKGEGEARYWAFVDRLVRRVGKFQKRKKPWGGEGKVSGIS